MRLWADKRGTSITIEYALTLLVAFSILGGVSVAVMGAADSSEQQVTANHLEVAGNEIAAQLEHQNALRQEYEDEQWVFDEAAIGDRMFETSVYVETPERTASGGYTVQIAPDGSQIILQSTKEQITVEVPIRDDLPVAESSGAPGDSVMIEYDDGEFVLRSGGE